MRLAGRSSVQVAVEHSDASTPLALTSDNLRLGGVGNTAVLTGCWAPLAEHPIVLAACNLADNRLRMTRVLFEDSNGPTSPPQWWASFDFSRFISGAIKSLWLWGNLYAIEHRDSQQRVLSLELVDPSIVSVSCKDGMPEYSVGGEHRVTTSGFHHIKYAEVPGQVLGLSALAASWRNIDMGVGADKFLVEHMHRGPRMSTIFKSDHPVGPKQTRDMQRMIQMQTSGPEMAWRPIIVSGVEVIQVGVSLADGQFMELANWSDARLCAAFQIDPSLLGIPVQASSRMTYQNVAHRDRLLWVDSLAGLAERIAALLTKSVGRERTVRFDDSKWMLGGISDRVAMAEKLALLNRHTGQEVVTVEQIRDFIGLPR